MSILKRIRLSRDFLRISLAHERIAGEHKDSGDIESYLFHKGLSVRFGKVDRLRLIFFPKMVLQEILSDKEFHDDLSSKVVDTSERALSVAYHRGSFFACESIGFEIQRAQG